MHDPETPDREPTVEHVQEVAYDAATELIE